jgi:hypothetical protein
MKLSGAQIVISNRSVALLFNFCGIFCKSQFFNFFLAYNRGDFIETTGGADNRLVTITGPPACAQTAHTLIMHRVKQTLDDERFA